MARLTERDDLGNWGLKGVPWQQLYPGKVITREIYEKIYGVLHKLMDYEDTEVSPDEVAELNEFERSNTEKYLKELAKNKEYKKLEEHGLLLKLPCKVGDTVYTNVAMRGWYFRKSKRPYKAKICFIGINGEKDFINIVYEDGNMFQFAISEIGKEVFLTREEAEQALERMEKGCVENGNKSGTIHME